MCEPGDSTPMNLCRQQTFGRKEHLINPLLCVCPCPMNLTPPSLPICISGGGDALPYPPGLCCWAYPTIAPVPVAETSPLWEERHCLVLPSLLAFFLPSLLPFPTCLPCIPPHCACLPLPLTPGPACACFPVFTFHLVCPVPFPLLYACTPYLCVLRLGDSRPPSCLGRATGIAAAEP